MASAHPWIRTRLWVMMLLEFLIWGSWYVPIGGYMNSTLGFTGTQIGRIYATTAIGAIISPLFVGYFADRLFATERVLAVLHFIGGVCLLVSATQTTFPALMTLLLVNAMCFMPTLALINSLSFRNIDDINRFSRIAVGGTIGWIVSGWAVEFLLGGAAKPSFFYLAGGGAIAMSAYCLTLPHTPPKGAAGGDVLGLGAMKLLKDPSFLVFAVCALLISIPLSFFYAWSSAFLVETERPWPVALLTLCQFSEIVVMIVMPWFIGRIGLKYVLVIGMAAWAVRFALFATLSFPLIIIGLLVHGFCYCFVFVAGFIYVGKKAPAEISASAQSFLAFLMWGVGMLVGTNLSGYAGDRYPPPVSLTVMKAGTQLKNQLLPAWSWTARDERSGKEVAFLLPRVLGSEKEDSLSVKDLEKRMPEQVTIGELTYDKQSLLAAATKVDRDSNGTITQAEWLVARSHVWPPIWLWPGGLAAVVCLLFLVGGRDVTPAKAQN